MYAQSFWFYGAICRMHLWKTVAAAAVAPVALARMQKCFLHTSFSLVAGRTEDCHLVGPVPIRHDAGFLGGRHRPGCDGGRGHPASVAGGSRHRQGGGGQLGPLALRQEHLVGRLFRPVRLVGSHFFHSPNTSAEILRHKVTPACKMVILQSIKIS